MSPQKEALITLIEEMSDEQITHLVQFIRAMKLEDHTEEINNILEDDPMVGFISGPTDIADHIEDFLYGDKHGNEWSQK